MSWNWALWRYSFRGSLVWSRSSTFQSTSKRTLGAFSGAAELTNQLSLVFEHQNQSDVSFVPSLLLIAQVTQGFERLFQLWDPDHPWFKRLFLLLTKRRTSLANPMSRIWSGAFFWAQEVGSFDFFWFPCSGVLNDAKSSGRRHN